ncbi:hypothetical protein JYU14_04155 [Simkania negevensis]|uniref:Uncharacterized protein n=1 Tax=Simkania negevensis TaxID=83561 RepID=A0ABS3ASZ1_9BACT|nr:hypothetical protein [Simkania negevensis]
MAHQLTTSQNYQPTVFRYSLENRSPAHFHTINIPIESISNQAHFMTSEADRILIFASVIIEQVNSLEREGLESSLEHHNIRQIHPTISAELISLMSPQEIPAKQRIAPTIRFRLIRYAEELRTYAKQLTTATSSTSNSSTSNVSLLGLIITPINRNQDVATSGRCHKLLLSYKCDSNNAIFYHTLNLFPGQENNILLFLDEEIQRMSSFINTLERSWPRTTSSFTWMLTNNDFFAVHPDFSYYVLGKFKFAKEKETREDNIFTIKEALRNYIGTIQEIKIKIMTFPFPVLHFSSLFPGGIQRDLAQNVATEHKLPLPIALEAQSKEKKEIVPDDDELVELAEQTTGNSIFKPVELSCEYTDKKGVSHPFTHVVQIPTGQTDPKIVRANFLLNESNRILAFTTTILEQIRPLNQETLRRSFNDYNLDQIHPGITQYLVKKAHPTTTNEWSSQAIRLALLRYAHALRESTKRLTATTPPTPNSPATNTSLTVISVPVNAGQSATTSYTIILSHTLPTVPYHLYYAINVPHSHRETIPDFLQQQSTSISLFAISNLLLPTTKERLKDALHSEQLDTFHPDFPQNIFLLSKKQNIDANKIYELQEDFQRYAHILTEAEGESRIAPPSPKNFTDLFPGLLHQIPSAFYSTAPPAASSSSATEGV